MHKVILFQFLRPCYWVKFCAKIHSMHGFWWKLQITGTEVGFYDSNLENIILTQDTGMAKQCFSSGFF